GYQGGRGAFAVMAATYRLYVTPEEAQEIVDRWRAANPWAAAFWGKHNQHESYGLWGAAMRAFQAPGTAQTAGRIAFIFAPSYLGGSLLMRLPSGRCLVYPWCAWREYAVKDKKTGTVKEIRHGLTFKRPSGFKALYGGLLAENATQGTCADLLREALVILEEGLIGGTRLDVILHSHDEIVAECDDDPAAIRRTLDVLDSAMTIERAWTRGFPLATDTTVRWYYSAAKLREAA
ncbi:MAG TPA: hypothetical protein VFS23_03140, partial [Vicinamibacterales bacterium]|nr:hypothetical protein [Vicinamibacterales bacterium]